MKKYIGTKQIEAEPMTRGDAWGKHLLREKPSVENFDDAGYHVRYEDVVAWMPIPSFDEILEANKDVLERIKEKGD